MDLNKLVQQWEFAAMQLTRMADLSTTEQQKLILLAKAMVIAHCAAELETALLK